MKKTMLIISAVVAAVLVLAAYIYIKNVNDIKTDTENFLAKTFTPTAFSEVEKYAKELNKEYIDYEDVFKRKVTVSTSGLNVIYKVNYNYALSSYEKKHLKERLFDHNDIYCSAFSDAEEICPTVRNTYFEYRDKRGTICTKKPDFKKYNSDEKAISEFIEPHKNILGGKYELSSKGTEVICTYTHDTTGMSEKEIEHLIGSKDDICVEAYLSLVKFRRECPEVTKFTFLHEDKNGNELHRETASVSEPHFVIAAYVCLFVEEKTLSLPEGITFNIDPYGEDIEFYLSFSALEKAGDSDALKALNFSQYYPYLFDEMNETFDIIKKECPEVSSIVCYYCDKNENPFNYEVFGEPRSGALYKHSSQNMPWSVYSGENLIFPYDIYDYNLNIRKNSYIIAYKFAETDDSLYDIYEACDTFIAEHDEYYQNFLKTLRAEVPELKSIVIDFYTYDGEYIYFAEYN